MDTTVLVVFALVFLAAERITLSLLS